MKPIIHQSLNLPPFDYDGLDSVCDIAFGAEPVEERLHSARCRQNRCAREMRLLIRHMENRPELYDSLVPLLDEIRQELLAARNAVRDLKAEFDARN